MLRLGLGLGLSRRMYSAPPPAPPPELALDPDLPVPTLSISEAQDEYPFGVDVAIEGAIPDDGTYSLAVKRGETYAAMEADDWEAFPITSEDPIDLGLGDIISPEETLLKARLQTATHYGSESNVVMHGDAVAPSITSTDTVSVAEMATLAKTIETDKLCYFAITGGAGSAYFELSGSEPADEITLRFVGDGTVNREVDGTSLAVEVTATGLNALTDSQTITVTITDVDEVASALGFTDVTGATPSTQYEDDIIIAGLAAGYSAPIEATGTGEYNLRGGGWIALPLSDTVANDDTLALRQTSDADYLDAVSIVVTVGDADNEVTDTWTVTNSAAPSDVIITPSSSGIPASQDPSAGAAASFANMNFGAGKHVVIVRYHYTTDAATCTIGGNAASLIAQSGTNTSGRTTLIFQFNGGSSGDHTVVVDATQTLSEVSIECFTVTNAADATHDSAVRDYGASPILASSALDVSVGGGGLAGFTWGNAGTVSALSGNLTQISYAALTTMSRQTSTVTPGTNVAPSLTNSGGSSGTVASVSWDKV